MGEDNVVQVIIDNEASYVATGRLLMQKWRNLFWTPCAAHYVDLMLEEIRKLEHIEGLIYSTKKVVKYIYNYGHVLSMIRKFTDGKEIVKPGLTLFATNLF